ncbi:MAG: ABC transporter ATP-binding protein [Proteobacteria bacterium]|nr:ABC transporter ATP-binding protein [Pseudomonadota bacterium]
MQDSLRIEGLSFSYSGNLADAVFREVNLFVEPGSVFCLLGPNGTGKSTLLKCISGLLYPGKGRVLVHGRDISLLRAADVARELGYVPQSQVSAFPFLVEDIVVMGRAPHLNVFASPKPRDVQIAYDSMETVGIVSLAKRPCTNLSGGEWQLTLIARALAQEPRIMVLDEPTSHLDMGNQMKILRVVQGLAERGLAIIMASHFPDHAFLLASQVAILNYGRIVQQGSPEEVITDDNMCDTYGVDVKVLYVGEGVDRKACFPSHRSGLQPSTDREPNTQNILSKSHKERQ